MALILGFFVGHWILSVFFQTFFLHRYAAHRMFTMSPRAERVFHLLTFVFQGSSYLNPRGYAILHREHHAFSDTERDPHSPHFFTNVGTMMLHTAKRYGGLVRGTIQPEPRFEGGVPSWPALERIADFWPVRLGWGVLYTLFYFRFAPHWACYALLPVHYLMGPVHGAIVNWCGHKYGYRNFGSDDRSRNTLAFDFLTLGELFQNNHHRFGMAPNFAARWFEVDPTWMAIRLFAALGLVKLAPHIQTMRWSPADRAEPEAEASALLPGPHLADAE